MLFMFRRGRLAYVLNTSWQSTLVVLQATLGIEGEGETSTAGDGSLYVFEGTDYSKSTADDEKAFDALIACKNVW